MGLGSGRTCRTLSEDNAELASAGTPQAIVAVVCSVHANERGLLVATAIDIEYTTI